MNVRVDLQETIYDGMEVKFKAPCDASVVTGLNLYYPVDGVVEAREFAFADANTNDLRHLDALFAEGAVVKVILDLDANMAFVQNADTNAYLEHRLSTLEGMIGTGGTSDSAKYNSIEDALNDKNRVANGKVTTHIVGDAINIILLDNIASASTINITKDCTLHLNGKKLSFTAPGAYLNINTASVVTINGEVAGSTIMKSGITSNASEALIAVTGTHLTVKGGSYSMTDMSCTAVIALRSNNATTKIDAVGCEINIDDVSAYARGAQLMSSATFDDCTISVTSKGQEATGILSYYDQENQTVTNSRITAYLDSQNSKAPAGSYACGIVLSAKSSIIKDCVINAKATGQGAKSIGIGDNGAMLGSKDFALTVENCHIEADGYCDCDTNNDGEKETYGAHAIINAAESSLTINGGYYWGAREALAICGTAYINGGIYAGCQHGGGYMEGVDIKVKNATFRNVEYTGDCGWNDTHFGAVYCGGSAGNAANVSFDNCRFESEVSTSHAVVAKYTNTKVYLSNSIIDGIFGSDLRADDSCVIYIGKNVFYNASKVSDNIDTTTNAGKEFGFETEPTDCENLIEIKISLLGGQVEQLGQAVKGKSYKKIDEFTLEKTAALDLTVEPDGKPYAFDAMLITAETAVGTTAGDVYFGFHNTDALFQKAYINAVSSGNRYFTVELYCERGRWTPLWSEDTNASIGAVKTDTYRRIQEVVPQADKYDYITRVKTYTVLGAGSTVRIYGIRHEEG